MDYKDRTLPEEKNWDSVIDVDDYIEWASFAVMSKRDGRRLLLCHTEEKDKGVWHFVALRYSEYDGLHYSGDGAIGKTLLQREIEDGVCEVTKDWSVCEKFIAPLPY